MCRALIQLELDKLFDPQQVLPAEFRHLRTE